MSTATLLAVVLVSWLAQAGQAQFFANRSVGGVTVDVDGVLSNPDVSELKQLRAAWQAGMQEIPADLDQPADLRFISLRRLEAEVARAVESGQPIPDAVRYLAGLQRVRYVLVYPDRNDIVLAGPAEGWRIDSLGNVVGATSNRPVLLLDDLMVALRAAESSNRSGISCSIDPTPEGIQRIQQLSPPQVSGAAGARSRSQKLEQALGPQRITVTGVPETSHLARVLVAADFRMKRLAMDFEPAPVDGMPSYLDLTSTRTVGLQNMMPRWWLAPNYEPLRRDEAGLAWELRGQGVKCLTEQDAMTAGGERQHTGQSEPIAQQWADAFTAKFDELAREDSSFGQLRNVMDLAVVAALLAKEGLTEFVALETPQLSGGAPLDEYPAPRTVASQASLVKKGRNWVISVSGGVSIYPWQVADRTEVSPDLASTWPAAANAAANWWWQ